MLWQLSGPPVFTSWISSAPRNQFYVLLSPCICFISFLYLDLYILGDDAWISKGSFMQAKHLCVLIHI